MCVILYMNCTIQTELLLHFEQRLMCLLLHYNIKKNRQKADAEKSRKLLPAVLHALTRGAKPSAAV